MRDWVICDRTGRCRPKRSAAARRTRSPIKARVLEEVLLGEELAKLGLVGPAGEGGLLLMVPDR
jgi:hypothetical protein